MGAIVALTVMCVLLCVCVRIVLSMLGECEVAWVTEILFGGGVVAVSAGCE